MKHLPNALSLARIVLTPVFLVAFLSGTFTGQLLAVALFIVLAISDWLDGYLARRLQVTSRFGQYIDPLADKVLVLGTFVAIMFLPTGPTGELVYEWWWWIPVALIGARDAAVTWLRSWASRRGGVIRTRGAAKAKTAVQLTFLIALQILIVAAHLEGALGAFAASAVYSPIPDILLVITAALTVWTGALYFTGVQPGAPTPPVQ